MFIPDIGGQTPPPYKARTRPPFSTPAIASDHLPARTAWYRPPGSDLIFGSPGGWTEAPGNPSWFPIEVANVGGAIGDGANERYLADFHTMLVTWHWYS